MRYLFLSLFLVACGSTEELTPSEPMPIAPVPVRVTAPVPAPIVMEQTTPITKPTPVQVSYPVDDMPLPVVDTVPVELPIVVSNTVDCTAVLGELEAAQNKNTTLANMRGYDPALTRKAQTANTELLAEYMTTYPECF
jgi:hypothetical protein